MARLEAAGLLTLADVAKRVESPGDRVVGGDASGVRFLVLPAYCSGCDSVLVSWLKAAGLVDENLELWGRSLSRDGTR